MTVPAVWPHGIPEKVLVWIRKEVAPITAPASLDAIDRRAYAFLEAAKPPEWAWLLRRYGLFQSLKRRDGEPERDHRARLASWLKAHRKRAGFAPGPGSLSVGTYMAPREDVHGSRLGRDLGYFPSARAIVLDLLADKALTMRQIDDLIDQERSAAGIIAPEKPGPVPEPRPVVAAEIQGFIRTIELHQIVPLWDLELYGAAGGKLETARAIYGNGESRALLAKLNKARTLQAASVGWISRLGATVGVQIKSGIE